MYTVLVIALIALIANVDACNRRRPPPPPPPPEAPPAPPVPPPIVKVVREQEQKVGFNKCYRKCSGVYIPLDAQGNKLDVDYEAICSGAAPPASEGLSPNLDPYKVTEVATSDQTAPGESRDQYGKPCGAESKCVYECTFRVYTEVALTTVTRPTGCGCAFHMTMVRPRDSTSNMAGNLRESHIANEVKVGDMELVVWDWKANRVVQTIPEFKLAKSEATQRAIEKQVQGGNTADFTRVTAGFAGQVNRFDSLPRSLDLTFPENANHVPALTFEITQIYSDDKIWDAPKQPQLEDMPNAYQSQCVPFWPHKPFCYNSMSSMTNGGCDGKDIKLYHKKFLLFPKTGKIGDQQGLKYAARFITSFYRDDDCSYDKGLFSIDSEFITTLKASAKDTELALGTWSWERVFKDGANGAEWGTHYVLGVPGRFSDIKEVWDKGYSTIQWQAETGFTVGSNTVEKKLLELGVCTKFAPTMPVVTKDKYGETAQMYRPEAGIRCAPFDDIAQPAGDCGTEEAPDLSLMAFLNAGEILNFNKRPDSTLIMGKMNSACNRQGYPEVVFDTLEFTGCPPGRHPKTKFRDKKRSLHADKPHLGLVYDEEAEGFVHFLHKRGHNAMRPAHKRSVADDLEGQVATPPNEENYDMRFAAGSVDLEGADGASAGDHPLKLFPETFSAPVNIDPQAENAKEIVEAPVTTGTNLPACHRGSIGCSCRVSGAKPCDIGMSCDPDAKKCLPENCKAGQAGCTCKNGECEGNNECIGAGNDDKQKVCRTKQSCTSGEPGCACDANNNCSGGATCAEGQCILGGGCNAGDPGCACGLTDDGCSPGFSCDPLAYVCLAPRCEPGTPGCRCHDDYTCKTGFQCNKEIGVCSVFQCPIGTPGCQCTAAKKCIKKGFNCVDFSTTGDSRCVAEPDATCGRQHERCVKECGMGNIARCPTCANGKVICTLVAPPPRTGDVPEICLTDPNHPSCPQSAASTMTLAAAALVALVATLF